MCPCQPDSSSANRTRESASPCSVSLIGCSCHVVPCALCPPIVTQVPAYLVYVFVCVCELLVLAPPLVRFSLLDADLAPFPVRFLPPFSISPSHLSSHKRIVLLVATDLAQRCCRSLMGSRPDSGVEVGLTGSGDERLHRSHSHDPTGETSSWVVALVKRTSRLLRIHMHSSLAGMAPACAMWRSHEAGVAANQQWLRLSLPPFPRSHSNLSLC